MDNSTVVVSSAITALITSSVSIYLIYKLKKTQDTLDNILNKYEKEKEVQKHLIYNYVDIKELPKLSNLVPQSALSFHENLARFCSEMCNCYNVPLTRILDVGCSVGGLSFSLSKTFSTVVGTDTSYAMLCAAQNLKQFGESSTAFSSEGGKFIQMYKTRIPKHADRERVTFWDEDVCALVYLCDNFYCVVAANVLTDLYDPKYFLSDIGNYVYPNGLLIIADTYHWNDGPEALLGGDGCRTTFSLIEEYLTPQFSFCKKIDIPFCMPQSSRLTLLGNSEVTVWQRR